MMVLQVAANVFLLLMVSVAQTEEVHRVLRNTQVPHVNKFIGVTTKCSRGSLSVEVRTEEAFWGSVYARGYPTKCRASGKGGRVTLLTMSSQECGIKILETEEGTHTYELLVYIQFDKWVQQVIDEQVHVRCNLDQDLGHLQASTKMNVEGKEETKEEEEEEELEEKQEEKQEEESQEEQPEIVRATARASQKPMSTKIGLVRANVTHHDLTPKRRPMPRVRGGVDRGRGRVEDEMGDFKWRTIPRPTELKPWNLVRKNGFPEPVSCWMDIISGTSMEGKPILDHLFVGEDATMVLKIRQADGLDTHVTSCVAHDGSGENMQDLIDARGCAVDKDIMPPLTIHRNSRSGIKLVHSSFRAFKFPDRDNLHLRCTVLVCQGQCPRPECGRKSHRVGRRLGTGRGSIQPVEDLGLVSPHASLNGRTNDRVLEGGLVRSSHRILDKVEVFNSVEVRAPGIESQPDLVKMYRMDREKAKSVDFFSEENMFCVTPYKMILAFGVLLAVLLASLLFALYTCVRAKYSHKRLHHQMEIAPRRHSPVATPYYRFPH